MRKPEGWRGPVAITALFVSVLGAAGCASAAAADTNANVRVGVECLAGTRLVVDLEDGVAPGGDTASVAVSCESGSGANKFPSFFSLLMPKSYDGDVLVVSYRYNNTGETVPDVQLGERAGDAVVYLSGVTALSGVNVDQLPGPRSSTPVSGQVISS